MFNSFNMNCPVATVRLEKFYVKKIVGNVVAIGVADRGEDIYLAGLLA